MLLSDHHRYHQRQRLRRNLFTLIEWALTIFFMLVIALGTAGLVAIWGGLVSVVP